MGWLKNLLELKDPDEVAKEEIDRMEVQLGSLRGNITHLHQLIIAIQNIKGKGKTVDPKIRENLFQTLNVVKRMLLSELALEEDIRGREKKEEAKTGGARESIIQVKDIRVKGKRGYFIGSDRSCDLVISGLLSTHILLKYIKYISGEVITIICSEPETSYLGSSESQANKLKGYTDIPVLKLLESKLFLFRDGREVAVITFR